MKDCVAKLILGLLLLSPLACGSPESHDTAADSGREAETVADAGVGDVEEPLPEPTYWSAESTVVVHDLNFVVVDGEPFFAIGFDTSSFDMWDGETGGGDIWAEGTEGGECDPATGHGYVNYQVEKNQAAASAGANFAYVWSYGKHIDELVNVAPPLKGLWHRNYGTSPAPENDVIPIIYNAYGEEDMASPTPSNAARMRDEFEQFRDREGRFSPEAMPHLPSFGDLPWYSWHPTHRMIACGSQQRLSPDLATQFAQSTNMMIGDWYTYIENRFDRSTAAGAALALFHNQHGDVGEGYDDWLEMDSPHHQELFSAAWLLGRSLVERRNPDAVVWLWLQGYAFAEDINRKSCEGNISDSYTTGPFPSDRYLRKEITSTIAAGGTGIIFFGWFFNRWPEAEKLMTFFRALSHEEVYRPVLTSPRLDIGVDTTYLGEEGHLGQGRIHAMLKWHEETRTAYAVIANPGAHETTLELDFPWTIAEVELLDWYEPGFVARPEEIVIRDRRVTYPVPKDEGSILRITPLMPPSVD